ncbi:serine rich and transmembrane domain containing 1 [Hoplias malabaricus]|uniref:serine rich and transmembrane domain containing 1 n=1 Tax=Hoplias malabaricus TaxID=27720 RepID=UPI003462B815
MSGIGGQVEDLNGTGLIGESFVKSIPTSLSTGVAAASSGRTESVYIYVSIFLSLLFFLLTLLIIALHRLKNIISSSSSYPECSSEAGSSFTNMEICSLSSQRSTVSSLSY